MKRMSVGVLTAAASGLVVGQAAAATKPHKTPPAPPPPPLAHRWTGFYLGGHLGGGWPGNDSATVTEVSGFGLFAPGSFGSSSNGSFLGGGQVGYNWQFASPWMVGVEADWTGTRLSQTGGGALPGGVGAGYSSTLRRDVKSLMSVRGRVGYVQDAMLYYITGGLAWGRTDYTANTISDDPSFPASFSNTAQGYVVGGGLAYALNANWSVRAEYLYYRLGGASQNALSMDANPPGNDGTVNYHWKAFQANIVRVGVDYQFGGL